MADIVSFLAITDDDNLNYIYAATVEGAVDSDGRVYKEELRNHPVISQKLSNFYHGTVEIGEVECEVSLNDPTTLASFRDYAVRNVDAQVQIRDVAAGVTLRTVKGKVQRITYTPDGTARVIVADSSDEVLTTKYPKMVVSGDLFGSEETNNLDLNLPIPIVLGATREHVPCRYIEEDFTNERFRYVYGCDLSVSTTTEPLVMPYPNTVYQSLNSVPAIVPSRNYQIERDVEIAAPPGMTDGGTAAGSLGAGSYAWYYTVLNGVGETTGSAPFLNSATFNGSSVGAQKLIFDPTASPTATGFRFYRGTAASGVYGLILEINDPQGYRTTDANGEVIYQVIDDGTVTPDTNTQVPLTNTTRGGLCSLLFDRMQYGSSSQLVPLTADIEFTEIAARSDTLGLWLFRDGEVRDIAARDMPRPVSSAMQNFWDFSDRVTASGTFNEIGQTFSGVSASILDRIGSMNFRTDGPINSSNYKTGIYGYSALDVTNVTGLDGIIVPSASCAPVNFNSTTSFRVNVIARPEVGTGDTRMVVIQKNVTGTGATWLLGVNQGRVWGLVGNQSGTYYEALGTSAIDGGWHELGLEVTRLGSVQGLPPVPSPAWGYGYSYPFESTQHCTATFPYTAGSNNVLVVTVHTRDKTQICAPVAVSIAGSALSLAVSASAGSNSPFMHTSIWDAKSPIGTTGDKSVLVTFAASTYPKSTVVNIIELFNINQGSGTTYRDVSGSASSLSSTSSTVNLTPAEAQNKSFGIGAITIPSHTVSLSPNSFNRRFEGTIDGIYKMKGAVDSRAENGVTGAIADVWQIASAQRNAHCVQWYKPLPSATGDYIQHDYLNVYVDRELEATTLIDGVGSLVSTGNFAGLYLGTGAFVGERWQGQIDSVSVQVGVSGSAIDPPFAFTNGKANAAPNALVCSSGTKSSPFVLTGNNSSAYDVGTSNFTLEGWIQITTTSVNQVIASHGSSTHGYVLGVNSSNQPYFTLRRNGTNTTTTSTKACSLGKWHFVSVAVTRESSGAAGSVRLFHDDQAQVSTTLTAATPVDISVASTFSIGGDRTGGPLIDPFRGYIDELHLFLGVRTSANAKRIWGLGMRNVVAQLQTFLESGLHGPGLTTDGTSFTTAITDIKQIAGPSASDENKFLTDFAWVEQQPLKDLLADVLRVRGMRLGVVPASGPATWMIEVDKNPGVTPSAFRFGDGVIENITHRPSWTTTDVREALKTVKVRYRIRRNSTGGIDGYSLRTSRRVVLETIGIDDEVEINTIRDRETADRYASYLASRLAIGDTIVEFDTGEDGRLLELGDIVTVTDSSINLSLTAQIVELRVQGMRHTFRAQGWSSNSYTYTAGTLPVDIVPESEPSYEGEVPLPPTGVTASYSKSSADVTDIKFEVKWTPPSKLYGGARISWRNSGLDAADYIAPWKFGAEVDKNNSGTIRFGVNLPSGTRTLTFGVQTRSPSGLYSAFARSAELSVTN